MSVLYLLLVCASAEILRRLATARERDPSATSIGNSVCRLDFDDPQPAAAAGAPGVPLGERLTALLQEDQMRGSADAGSPFGTRYRFSLGDALVDCPEFLVPLPHLTRIAAECGLELRHASNLSAFIEAQSRVPEHQALLDGMQCLPTNDHPEGVSDSEWNSIQMYLAAVFVPVPMPAQCK